jgi:hypothetical protein
MRYEVTASALADYRRLSDQEQQMFKAALALFNECADRYQATGDPRAWAGRLRVKAVANATGVFEMTWSFRGPDGRATWEWSTTIGEDGSFPVVRWRRVGGHEIFAQP